MLVITGATGKLGSQVLHHLLRRVPADQLVASVRDTQKAADLLEKGVLVRAGNFAQPAELTTAFAGAAQVLVVSPDQVGELGRRLSRTAIDAAHAAGARRVLYTSHMGAQADSPTQDQAFIKDHAAIEAYLLQTGRPFTALRHGYYAESALHHIGRGFETGAFSTPEDGPVSWTTRADLAEADALVLAEEGRLDGQQEVDFDQGLLLCMAPRQVLSIQGPPEPAASHQGWLLLVHPDLLGASSLAQKIRHYEYFDYRANEALHVSEPEQQVLVGLLHQIEHEYRAQPDKMSQQVIVAQLDLLLTYVDRFYQRQFQTRQATHQQLLSRLEEVLKGYCSSATLATQGMPPVTYLAEAVHLSPNYLSRLLKTLTGQSTKQFILSKVIELAKEKLATTTLTMNEIAYELGFAHPQSFSKLFKSQTQLSPRQFRQSFA